MNAPLVGMFFRPPAQQVTASLPLGSPLWIEREPTNAYDPNACKVLLPAFSADGPYSDIYAQLYELGLEDGQEKEFSSQWYKHAMTDPLFLGYVSAKTGHAEALVTLMRERGISALPATYSLTMDGKPQVEFD